MRTSINLLPASVRRRALLRRRARQWGAIWALAAAVALAIVGARLIPGHDADFARAEAQQRQADRLAKSEKKLADLRARLAALREQQAAVGTALDEAPALSALGVVSQCARRVGGAIHVEGLTLARSDAKTGSQTPPAAPARGDQRVLTLRGMATDSLAVAAFATGLREAGLFASVERKLPDTQAADEKQPVPYLIECRF